MDLLEPPSLPPYPRLLDSSTGWAMCVVADWVVCVLLSLCAEPAGLARKSGPQNQYLLSLAEGRGRHSVLPSLSSPQRPHVLLLTPHCEKILYVTQTHTHLQKSLLLKLSEGLPLSLGGFPRKRCSFFRPYSHQPLPFLSLSAAPHPPTLSPPRGLLPLLPPRGRPSPQPLGGQAPLPLPATARAPFFPSASLPPRSRPPMRKGEGPTNLASLIGRAARHSPPGAAPIGADEPANQGKAEPS